MTNKCPLCVSTETVSNPLFERYATPYVQCGCCGLGYQLQDIPKRFEGPHESRGDQMSDRDKEINRALAAHLAQYVPKSGAVLDIGAKYPFLMHALREIRQDVYTHAIDGIPEILEFGPALDVAVDMLDIEKEPMPTGDWNLITLIHCLEHFSDPLATMQKIANPLVVTKGRIFIRCPLHDVGGIQRDFTPGHYEIHPVVFCAKAIHYLASRLGMVVTEMSPMVGAGQGDFVLCYPSCGKTRIGVGMIVKNEERDLPDALESIVPYADVLYVVDTGSTDGTPQVLARFEAENPQIECYSETYLEASEQDESGEWKLNDFSQARNRYVACLEALGCTHIFSLDADDYVQPFSNLKARIQDDADAYDFQIVDDFEKPTTRFNHMRLWKTGLGIRYEGPCHEYPTLKGRKVDSGVKILHRWDQHASVEPSTSRNLRILKRAHDHGDNTPRTLFYLANSYRDCQQWADAIATYRKYFATGGGWHDERVFAWLYLSRCYRFSGQLAEAISAAHSGLAEDERFAELYVELAYTYSYTDAEKMACYAAIAHTLSPPATQLFLELNKYQDQPLRLLASYFENETKLAWAGEGVQQRVAKYLYERILEYAPGDEDMTDALARVSPPAQNARHFCRPGAAGDVLCALAAVQCWQVENASTKVVFHSDPRYRELVEATECTWAPVESGPHITQMIGYPLNDGYPDVAMKKHLIEYFGDEIGVSVKAPFSLGMHVPLIPQPKGQYVTLQCVPGWSPYKTWNAEKWQTLANWLVGKGIEVHQIGAADEHRLAGTVYRCGELSLLESIALIHCATLHIGVDSFGNHATMVRPLWSQRRAKGLILWGSTSAVGSGYAENINFENIGTEVTCRPCYREYPNMTRHPKPPCPHGNGTWEQGDCPCMSTIEPWMLTFRIERVLNEGWKAALE